MSRWHSYLNSAKEILSLYKGEEPFASFIKKHFSANKKFGSADRKLVSHLCYCYFRLGKSLPGLAVEERILTALFLCSDAPNKLLEELRPEWNERTGMSWEDKTSFLGHPDLVNSIFPWVTELSDGIDREAFVLSHLQQSVLFLRLRHGKEKEVKDKLGKGGITFTTLDPTCIALPNSSKIDELVVLDKEAVVQDYSSQRVGEFLSAVRWRPSDRVWDCCAASGGKSIMAKDILGDIELTVSDIRESILANLRKRFAVAGITGYKALVMDLAKENIHFPTLNAPFSLILADVPCSGSGTWGRTPEQLFYFDTPKINTYSLLQQKIISNAITYLEPGGYLLYITCSVFKKENEEMVNFIKDRFQLQAEKMELIKGYDKKADTMFAALLRKPL